jgi:hypothetical protein
MPALTPLCVQIRLNVLFGIYGDPDGRARDETMELASRSTTLRRAGAFLALVAFEIGAVAILHRLGELPWLRIPFDDLEGWLQTSAPEDVLAAVVRLIALGAAWWLLGSTALYALARLSRIPGAIKALERVTLPSVRRIADQAIALTLATSIMSGGTNAALANPSGIPIRHESVVATHDPLSTWTRAATLGYQSAPSTTDPPAYQPEAAGPSASQAKPGYEPEPAGKDAKAAPGAGATTTSSSSTTSSTRPTTTTEPPTTTTTPPTTTAPPTTTEPTTTGPPPSSTSTTAPPTTSRPGKPATAPYVPRVAGTAAPSSTRPPTPAAPRYTPGPAGPPVRPPAPLPEAPPGKGETGLHHVAEGDNLWTIARDRLAKVTGRPAGQLSEREIARYWLDVVDANRASLRSGDPDLIFPGEMIKLPPVTRHEP